MPAPTIVDEARTPETRWISPTGDVLRYRPFFSAPETDTSEIVCGVAIMAAGDRFTLHSHPQAEVYYGLEGEAEVLIDGTPYRMAPGVALFIPGHAVHGIPLATGPVKWFYTFAATSLNDIPYSFPQLAPAKTEAPNPAE